MIGPLVLFVPVGAGWPYYARPRVGERRPIGAADVRAVRARQRELLIPESFEWIGQTAPGMAAAALDAGLRVRAHPLLVLHALTAVPPVPPRVAVRLVAPSDPELDLVWAVPGVAFGHPGTEIGEAGVTERDKLAAGHDGEAQEAMERAEARLLDRDIDPRRIGNPSRDPVIALLAQARDALTAGDRMRALELLQRAQTQLAVRSHGTDRAG